MPQLQFGPSLFKANGAPSDELGVEAVSLERICYISKGMVLHSEDPAGKIKFKKDDLISATQDTAHPKRFMEGKYMDKWVVRRVLYLEYGTRRSPALCSRPTFPELYEVPEKLISMDLSGGEVKVAYDDRQLFHNHSSWSFVPWYELRGVRNRSIQKAARYTDEMRGNEGPEVLCREESEDLSHEFEPKFVLAVMNSGYAKQWLGGRRRSKIHIYPDDWKDLPVPLASHGLQSKIACLVDQILGLYQQHGYPLTGATAERLAELEQEIDNQVCAIYGLA